MVFRLLVAVLLVFAGTSAWADTSPRLINMDSLPQRDLTNHLTRVATLTSPCDGAVRFGRDGETLIVDCDGTLSLGRHHRDFSNLNALGEELSSGQARTLHIHDSTSGALLRTINYARTDDLVPLAQIVGDGAWIAGTDRSATGPQIFALYGDPPMRYALRQVRSQFVAALRIDDRRVAIVYEAWSHQSRNGGGFPEPFVAVVDIEDGAVLSDARLDWANGPQSIATNAVIDANGVVLFYRRFNSPPQQSDSYTGGARDSELVQQRFAFDGSSQGAPIGFGFDAGGVLFAGDRLLIGSALPEGCRNVIAALQIRGETRQCYQLSRRDRPPGDHLRRQRPTEVEQYGYDAKFMGGGAFVVVTGSPGVDERARNPSARTTTHVFQADNGQYLGVSTAIWAVASDAPLLATREDNRITIWRLTP